jgi:steroid delta-isomerase-like uncharacterized protein
MKIHYILIIFIVAIPFSANCISENKQDQTILDNRAIIEKLTEFWASGNLDMIDDLFTEECAYEDVPDQGFYHGREEIKSFLGEMYGWSPDLKVRYTSTLYQGDWAAAEWIWNGTQTGDIMGLMEATDKEYSVRGTTIFQFEDGKIKRLSDYYNAGRLLHQLGVKFVLPSGEVMEVP